MAGNQILTISMITRAAVRIWKNTNFFIQNIGTQYDDQFARDGAKIGTALRIRLPNEYTVRHGAAAQPQDTNEQQIVMTLSTQDGVDVSFSSAERTMALDDYVERILAPKIAFLTADVAYTIMAGLEGSVANYVANVDGSGAVMSPTQFTVLRARAALMNNSAPYPCYVVKDGSREKSECVGMRREINVSNLGTPFWEILNPSISISPYICDRCEAYMHSQLLLAVHNGLHLRDPNDF